MAKKRNPEPPSAATVTPASSVQVKGKKKLCIGTDDVPLAILKNQSSQLLATTEDSETASTGSDDTPL